MYLCHMQNRFVTAAVETTDIAAAYDRWRATHPGVTDDLIAFLTAPSADRDLFILHSNPSHAWSDTTLRTMI